MKKQTTIKKHYLDNRFLSHTIVPLTGTNLPTGAVDPGDEQPDEDGFEAERNRIEEAKENQHRHDL